VIPATSGLFRRGLGAFSFQYGGKETVGAVQVGPEVEIFSRIERDALLREHLVARTQAEGIEVSMGSVVSRRMRRSHSVSSNLGAMSQISPFR